MSSHPPLGRVQTAKHVLWRRHEFKPWFAGCRINTDAEEAFLELLVYDPDMLEGGCETREQGVRVEMMVVPRVCSNPSCDAHRGKAPDWDRYEDGDPVPLCLSCEQSLSATKHGNGVALMQRSAHNVALRTKLMLLMHELGPAILQHAFAQMPDDMKGAWRAATTQLHEGSSP